jgi:hypothetical protein
MSVEFAGWLDARILLVGKYRQQLLCSLILLDGCFGEDANRFNCDKMIYIEEKI